MRIKLMPHLKNGMLKLVVPKKEEVDSKKVIEIK